MTNIIPGAASIVLACAIFVGLGFAAHDGGAIPFQSAEQFH